MRGRSFFKMTGSGNDFVVFDARVDPPGELASPDAIARLCARGTGVGADGVVFMLPPHRSSSAFRMEYYNRDGSRGEMCGNAALCSARLAVELGLVDAEGFDFDSDAGIVRGRMRGAKPEIDFDPVEVLGATPAVDLERGERRIGFARVGVPHLVLECDDVENLELERRGRALRHHASLADGANVNFVARAPGGWKYRTYERGVEGETLACGTGAVAVAALLTSWQLSGDQCLLLARSGRELEVTFRRRAKRILPSLSGEGRLVFEGVLGEL